MSVTNDTNVSLGHLRPPKSPLLLSGHQDSVGDSWWPISCT